MLTEFERIFKEWSNKISGALKDTEDMKKDERDAGPKQELDFWKQRMRRLTGIKEQLSSKNCRNRSPFSNSTIAWFVCSFSFAHESLKQFIDRLTGESQGASIQRRKSLDSLILRAVFAKLQTSGDTMKMDHF